MDIHFGGSVVSLLNFIGLLVVSSTRLYVVMFVLPASGENVLEGMVRNGAVLLWSSLIAVGQAPSLTDFSALNLVILCIREAIIGLVIGMAASTIFWAAEGLGVYLDDISSFNSVQISNPLRTEQSTPLSSILSQFAISIFWSYGGMIALLGAIYQSYAWWPLHSIAPMPLEILKSFIGENIDGLMLRIAKLTAPIVFILILIDIGVGFVNRNAEKLELTNLSQPIKGILAILMVALLTSMIIDQIKDELSLASFSGYLARFLH
ncbi:MULTISPECIES: type III secretion system export apparatus subunit SctT [unclassified Caballeronia]|uniref:type III secretion system export apparatus subunit SctT n=2 Tax=Caballeronia TaxID=1827195 RepID=UPI0020288922|nr:MULTISPECIES: type III secretion system export apparatus subunit SctT [unclassified Caballeronia]